MRCFAVMAWFMNVHHEVTYANDSTSPTVVSPPPFFSARRVRSFPIFVPPLLTARWITYLRTTSMVPGCYHPHW